MNEVATIRSRRIRRRSVRLAILVGTGGLLMTFAPEALAVTGTGSTQTTTFTPSAQLSITSSPVSLGTVATTSSLPVSLGSVLITDTEADSTNWTASVAASDCFPPTSGISTLNTASATIPATAITYNAGSGTLAPTTSLTTGTPALATLGGTQVFGAAPAGGTLAAPTFGSPLTVASTNVSSSTLSSDPVNNDGTYTVSPSMDLNLSSSSFAVVPETYTCTLQYTITG